MKIERRCPKCRAHRYHFCDARLAQTERRAEATCAECGHNWKVRLSRSERDLDQVTNTTTPIT